MTYQPGEEIFKSQPFSYVLMNNALSKVCDFCLRSQENCSLKCCSKCKIVYFCQNSCLEKAWKSYHKHECKCLRKINNAGKNKSADIPQDIVRLLARIIFKLQKEHGYEDFEILPNGQKRYFIDLMSHKEEIMKWDNRLMGFHQIYSDLKNYFIPKENLPSKTEVLEIFGKLMINSFFILSEKDKFIGKGLFLGASILDHSCNPNAVWICKGKELIIRYIGNNEKVDKFSDLRISYIPNLYENSERRRELLMEDYFFICQCSRCQDEVSDQWKSSFKCSYCSNGFVPFETGNCVICKHQCDSSRIQKYAKLKIELFEENDDGKKVYENDESMFEQAMEIFHPYDEDFIQLLNIYFRLRLAQENHVECLKICQLILTNYHQNIPFHVNTGLFEVQAARSCIELNHLEAAESHIKKAKTIFQVIYGDDQNKLVNENCDQICKTIEEKKKKKDFVNA